MAGAGTAILIDAFALSWDTPHPRSDGAAVRWSPTVSLGLQGATAGVGGAF
jgi:hypothetical protein